MRLNSLLKVNVLLVLLASFMLSGCGGSSNNSDPPAAKQITGITVYGYDANTDFVEGQTRQIQARLEYDDGTSENLAPQAVTWSSSDATVVSVSTQGILTAVAAGSAEIQALSNEQTDALAVTVVEREMVQLRIDPEAVVLPAGTSSTVKIYGIFNDQTQQVLGATDLQELVSSDTTVFTLDETQFGRLIAEATGTAVLTARTQAGLEASIQVRVDPAALVSLMISADELVQPAGLLINASALGTFTDGSQRDVTTNVNWSVAGVAGAQVSAAGVVSSLTPGVVVVTAASNDVSASLELTFSEAILEATAILSGDGEIPLGRTLQLTLRGSYSDGTTATISGADWSVDDEAIITIDQDGKVEGIGLGIAEVTALFDAFTATATIRVTEAVIESLAISLDGVSNGSIPAGFQAQATATGTYSDGGQEDLTDEVVWSFAPDSVASVSAGGTVSALSPGNGDLTAVYRDLSAQVALEVTPAVIQSVRISMDSLIDGQVTKAKGLKEPIQLIGSFSDGNELALPNASVNWVIDDSSIATVTTDGQLQFLAIGTTTVEGRYEGFSDTISATTSEAIPLALVISQMPEEIYEGTKEEIAATVFYSDNSEVNVTDTANWVSSDPGIATVLQGGGEPTRVQGLARGVADISASRTLNGVSLSDSVMVEVLPSVLVLECYSRGFFEGEWQRCGSSDGGLVTSSSSTISVLPRPEWFTLAEFRFIAEGRDWTVAEVVATNSNPSVEVRVVGIEDGAVIPEGATVEFELQVQPTNNVSVTNDFTVDVVGNSGAPVRIITGTYTIRTN